MTPTFDIAGLRALVAVADLGGVTRASAQLNLTQSAVSLQIKRLEESLDLCLIERVGRGVSLTTAGEQVVAYARPLLALNDEIADRFAGPVPASTLRFGLPCSLMRVPQVLRAFGARQSDVRVQLTCEPSTTLRERFEAGAYDLILTTETDPGPGPGGEAIARLPLVWVGAADGTAWRRRPLPVATSANCAFSRALIATLGARRFDWRHASEPASTLGIEGLLTADLGVFAMLAGAMPPGFEAIEHRGALPTLPEITIALYATRGPRRRVALLLADALRRAIAEDAPMLQRAS